MGCSKKKRSFAKLVDPWWAHALVTLVYITVARKQAWKMLMPGAQGLDLPHASRLSHLSHARPAVAEAMEATAATASSVPLNSSLPRPCDLVSL